MENEYIKSISNELIWIESHAHMLKKIVNDATELALEKIPFLEQNTDEKQIISDKRWIYRIGTENIFMITGVKGSRKHNKYIKKHRKYDPLCTNIIGLPQFSNKIKYSLFDRRLLEYMPILETYNNIIDSIAIPLDILKEIDSVDTICAISELKLIEGDDDLLTEDETFRNIVLDCKDNLERYLNLFK